jgi:hypothetical protein
LKNICRNIWNNYGNIRTFVTSKEQKLFTPKDSQIMTTAAAINPQAENYLAIVHLNKINRRELMIEAHKWAKYYRSRQAAKYATYAQALAAGIRQAYRDIAVAKDTAIRSLGFISMPITVESLRNFFVSNETGIDAPFACKNRLTFDSVKIARKVLAAQAFPIVLEARFSEVPTQCMGYESVRTHKISLRFDEAGELVGFDSHAPAELGYVASLAIRPVEPFQTR